MAAAPSWFKPGTSVLCDERHFKIEKTYSYSYDGKELFWALLTDKSGKQYTENLTHLRLKNKYYQDYPTDLDDIKHGYMFEMLNYNGLYMRVQTDGDISTIVPQRFENPCKFNDDGVHVPIMNLSKGKIFWMSKIKPCRLYQPKLDSETTKKLYWK